MGNLRPRRGPVAQGPQQQAMGVTPKFHSFAARVQVRAPGSPKAPPAPGPVQGSRGTCSGSPAAGLGVWGPGSSLNPDCHTRGPRTEERSTARAKCFQKSHLQIQGRDVGCVISNCLIVTCFLRERKLGSERLGDWVKVTPLPQDSNSH